ncbi:MAG: hypothetical protein HOU81_16625 [Hamadaea sp.]|uniref:hypothetical protein n=1 Tax=Hamadaea sp. TaxID=2024425 RepID=UPI0018113EBA|nr:hypothetical protein [Hamadaea sp.]NUR72442.1 hypothetical protein [Hamadaea sp.]NUT19967.1 hypothetical protein [Hamadaea sp.]
MPVDGDRSEFPDVSRSSEMTHAAMMERWQLGLVTPMSATISTFAKTDGSWWTAVEAMWQRVSVAAENDRLDFHHDRFGRSEQASGPATAVPASPWDKRPPSSLFRAPGTTA